MGHPGSQFLSESSLWGWCRWGWFSPSFSERRKGVVLIRGMFSNISSLSFRGSRCGFRGVVCVLLVISSVKNEPPPSKKKTFQHSDFSCVQEQTTAICLKIRGISLQPRLYRPRTKLPDFDNFVEKMLPFMPVWNVQELCLSLSSSKSKLLKRPWSRCRPCGSHHHPGSAGRWHSPADGDDHKGSTAIYAIVPE